MTLRATYAGANGWLLEFVSEPPGRPLRVLVDPWLAGPLVFPPGPWLLRGELNDPLPPPQSLDLLLLTQGLADHCHPPSLALLPRQLPVLASASAAARVRGLGFTQVTALAPGQVHRLAELTITASAGAPVPQTENGYVLEHPGGSLYLEPHGFLARDLPPQRLDAVITPVLDLGLPLAGAFVRGRQVLPDLLERFQPTTVLASTTGGDVRFSGALAGLLRSEGSLEEAAGVVERGSAGRARLIQPQPGIAYSLPVQGRPGL
ncbi:MAG: MBL fold metallo-hydrolase [Synechococcus sp.]|nr:MBL fold metallo-hydrolase [Synechococcus sp.]